MTAPQQHRGQRIGLPERGTGSLAATGPRLFAFLVDAVASSLVAALFAASFGGAHHTAADRLPGTWSLIPLALDYILGVLLTGRTLGMFLFGLHVVRIDRPEPVGIRRVAVRTILLFLLVPAVVFDQDGRGLHDRLTDTAVVRS